jgi:MHS family alpha-ketoglutarate permease-like MFS transporter
VSDATTPGDASAEINRASRRAILAGSIGNAVEFVDWNIYATFSAFFADQFFPSTSGTTALLSTLAVFAAGFVMRPVGAAVLGSFSDRRGRKAGLTLGIGLMAGASLLIAVCPTYSSIGVAAPAVLLFARLVQGFSNGGEFGASATFLVEMAPPGRRAFFGSWQQVAVSTSHIIVAGLGTAFAFILSSSRMHAWGWRIAFLFGALLGLAGLWLRVSIPETEAFTDGLSRRGNQRLHPFRAMFTQHPKAAIRVFGITVAGTLTYYIWITYMATYAHVSTGMPLATALLANTIAVVAFTCLIPVGGLISDRLGRKPTMMMFSGGFAVIAWPALHLMRNNFWTMLGIELIGVFFLVGYSANLAAVMAEQFPTEARTVGVAFPYALAVAVFGGTAPYITTWLVAHDAVGWTSLYVVAASLVSFAVYATMPETNNKEIA